MNPDNYQTAYDEITSLSDSQGYLTYDDIIDSAVKYSLPVEDFDRLSGSIAERNIPVYKENPQSFEIAHNNGDTAFDNERDDFSQIDYNKLYNKIVEIDPSLGSFISEVREIKPPQRGEIRRLKYQMANGDEYARTRMIEMYLRVALRIAFLRFKKYGGELSDIVASAYIGLIYAADKYDYNRSDPFISYASYWIFQSINREQENKRPLIYYPVHIIEGYLKMYPILKERGCAECDRLPVCDNALRIVRKTLSVKKDTAKFVISQMIPVEDIDTLPPKTLISEEEGSDIEACAIYTLLKEQLMDVLDTLTPREEKVIKLRFGLEDGRVRTLEEIGTVFRVTRERIRQIEQKALRKLRHPSRSKKLKDFL